MASKIKTANGVDYRFVGEYGSIRMENAKTINRYLELKSEQPKSENYGVFFAFNEEQFEEGRKRLISKGYLKEGEKLCRGFAGMYGTAPELKRYMDFYVEREKLQKEECNPQEVYFYEWNNHECMVSMDDDDALEIVISIFGKKVAHTIHRVYPGTPTNVLAPLTERDRHLGEHQDTLRMIGRLSWDCRGFLSEGDCRYHYPLHLWAGCVRGQIDELRKQYARLPDDIKDESPVTKEQIDDFARQMYDWADMEFSKPEYNPVMRTPYEKYHGLEIELDEKLYYKDDDGNYQTPTRIWFSCDTRRWHADGRQVHGRAMTTYLGKNGGTVLTPVLISCTGRLGMEPYRRDDLCDIECSYEYKPLHGRLYDFRPE